MWGRFFRTCWKTQNTSADDALDEIKNFVGDGSGSASDALAGTTAGDFAGGVGRRRGRWGLRGCDHTLLATATILCDDCGLLGSQQTGRGSTYH